MRFEFSLYSGVKGLHELKDAWLALANDVGTHFLHFPAWYEAELAARADDSGVYFISVKERGVLTAVLPFEATRIKKMRLSLPVMRLFYLNEMGVNDVLSRTPLAEYLKSLTAFMRSSLPYFCLIQWQCILKSGHAFSAGLPFHASHESKYLDLSSGAQGFWENYSKKFVRNVRRKERKATEQGALRLEVVNRLSGYEAAFNEFLKVEASGWKGEGGTSIAQQPSKLSFYRTLMNTSSEHAHINLLWLDDVCIAAQFSLRVGTTLYLLKIGFKEDFANISPGVLILTKLIDEYSEQAGISKISFVTGVGWIDSWHPSSDVVGVSYSASGRLLSGALVRILNNKKGS